MSEKEIKVFLDSVVNYFQNVLEMDVKIGSPYLASNAQPTTFNFTGIIGISGPYQGTVCFTAPKILLTHLLLSLGEHDTSYDNILDLVGEVANTISGNARAEFGGEFIISVPVVLESSAGGIYLPRHLRSYVIPIYWKAYSAAVVVCLDDTRT